MKQNGNMFNSRFVIMIYGQHNVVIYS